MNLLAKAGQGVANSGLPSSLRLLLQADNPGACKSARMLVSAGLQYGAVAAILWVAAAVSRVTYAFQTCPGRVLKPCMALRVSTMQAAQSASSW